MKDVCDKHGALLILDEVFCGMGRTGTQHSWQAEGVVPHLQTVAKALGAGHQPISALLVNKSVMEKIHAGSNTFRHDQTYQGHPVACAAAYEVQRIIQEENLVENAGKVGEYLGSELKRRLLSHKNVGDIRGVGLMWGVRTNQPVPLDSVKTRQC
jgi:adenosylmethionine-8-amino-7-oxononanoate aminotransferase